MNRTMIAFLRSGFVLFAGVLVTAPLLAHHGRGASYDNSKIETIQGTVSEWAWRNPHYALYVDVKEADGKVVNWGLERQSVGSLSKLGMNRRSCLDGQEL